MKESVNQQLIISGVGGQGVLFVTRLLAEAAILKGMSVFTSETHGMAQRGGTVISHLKTGDFSSPLIRPGQADGLLALRAENLRQHGAYLKTGGWAVVNDHAQASETSEVASIDADALAGKIGNPKAVNLILLGFALSKDRQRKRRLFCSFEDVKAALEKQMEYKKEMLKASLMAIEEGVKGEE